MFDGRNIKTSKPKKKLRLVRLTCLWSYVPVIGFRDYRSIFELINIQIGLLTVVSRHGASASVSEQRIRNCNLKCVRHREPEDNI